MATYYVRQDGSDSNTGLGSTVLLAWKTIGKVFASGSVVTGGDIVYIAPGTYTESISVLATSPTSEVQIIGNPTSSQFGGVNAGVVKLSAYNAAGTAVVNNNTYLITATSKNYYAFSNIVFESAHTNTISGVEFFTSRYIKFNQCVFRTENNPGITQGSQMFLSPPTSQRLDAQITNCYFGPSNAYAVLISGQSQTSDTTKIENCYFDGGASERLLPYSITAAITNCTFVNVPSNAISQSGGSANAFLTIKNCLFKRCTTAISGTSSVSGAQTYNRFVSCTNTVTNIPASGTSTSTGVFGVDSFESLLFGINNLQPGTSYADSPNKSFGNATGAPATDLYGVTWTGTSPDAGSGTYRVITSNPTNIAYNGGNDRNASTITIAPGSTSQSIELYLGATGLTASTSGLSARYNRTRTASVDIPLVARTIAQAWTSGGFAEVDATNMPGVYRLDLPDAALAAGADDVTIVVRGASGSNGAVMTVKLSSGGLTSAQTAAAVLDAVGTSYATAGSIGYAIQNSNVASISGSTAAADELEGALLHNGTDYISADLLTPITSAALVRMGPYEVKADGLGASDPLEIQKGAQHGVDIQCVDVFGSGIDITSATVTAKVYNTGATLVDTYACTATYAADGRATFVIDTTVTNTPGTYTATITRTTGASDTQIFGPLRIYVRDI